MNTLAKRKIDFEGQCISMGYTEMPHSGICRVHLITRHKDDGSLTPVFVLIPQGDPVLAMMAIGKVVQIRGVANLFEIADDVLQSNHVIVVTALERRHLC